MSGNSQEEAALQLPKSHPPPFVDVLEQRPLFLLIWLVLQEGIQVASVAYRLLDIC